MMARGMARCALNAVLDDVNFKGHRYFKGTIFGKLGNLFSKCDSAGVRELVAFDALSETQHCFDRISTT